MMTNMQFYIALAVPSILVILSWLQQDKRLARVESVVDRLDSRIDRLDGRIDRLDGRIDHLDSRIDARLNTIEHDLRQFYSVTGELKGRVDELARR